MKPNDKNIESEIQNWKNLRFNSEKMLKELNTRANKIINEIENIIKLPETIAIKKGGLMQSTSSTESEKQNLENELFKAETVYQDMNKQLKKREK